MLGQLAQVRENNLDSLRLFGAVLVIFAHGFAIVGVPAIVPPFYKGHYGSLGVDIFFIISGFLITQSYLRSRNPARFVWSRFLRIFPALVLVTCLLVFVVGPLLTTLTTGEYFAHPWTFSYLRGALSLYEVTRYAVLPGVFMNNPIVQTNGPLWTLQYEWTFYFVVLLLGVTSLLARKRFVVFLFVTSLVLTYLNMGATANIYWTPVKHLPVFFMYFSFGALAYLYRDQIPMIRGAFLFVMAMLIVGSFNGGFSDTIFVFLLGYLVLFVGFSPGINLSWLTKYGDFSYGLYIWGWPVQQTVYLFLGKETNVWLQMGISLFIALLLAMLSWHLVEKRCLRLKGVQLNFLAGKAVSQTQSARGIVILVSIMLCLCLFGFYRLFNEQPLIIKYGGPLMTKANTVFNRQPDGNAAMWLEVKNATESTHVMFGSQVIKPDFNSSKKLTFMVPKELYSKPGKYNIYIFNPANNNKSNGLDFTVE
ncbi:MAG: acyltransferase family protein [Smithellaceae bacterium]